jgi:hypothetical protein
MGHPRVAKDRLPIDSLPVKSREDCRGGSTVKAAVMKAETNLRRSGQKLLARGKKVEELATAKPLKMDVRPAIVKRKPGLEETITTVLGAVISANPPAGNVLKSAICLAISSYA